MKLKIGSKTVDLKKAFPLTLGDWKRLEKEEILGPDGQLAQQGAIGCSRLLLYIVNKIDPDVTEENLEDIELPTFGKIANWLQEQLAGEEPADPKS